MWWTAAFGVFPRSIQYHKDHFNAILLLFAYRYGTFSVGQDHNTEKPLRWEEDVITYFAHQNRGMSGLILSFRYSIGYLSIADAVASNIEFAYLVNQHGNKVIANTTTIQAAMDAGAASSQGQLSLYLTEFSGPYSYPISGYTNFIVKMSTMDDCETAVELLRYIVWFLTDEQVIIGSSSSYHGHHLHHQYRYRSNQSVKYSSSRPLSPVSIDKWYH